MLNNCFIYRAFVYSLLVCLLQMMLAPTLLTAQSIECMHDKSNPTIDNARSSFKSLNYDCAEQEILGYLLKERLTGEQKADAHIFLATVYYLKLKNENGEKERVIEQFRAAFQSKQDWRGELEVNSTEFIAMMNEAKELTNEEAEEEETLKKSKPWYTKWWAIGLGVGIVAAVVVAASSGGDDEEPVDNTLPGFPNPPASKK
jgi:hypothetical protein